LPCTEENSNMDCFRQHGTLILDLEQNKYEVKKRLMVQLPILFVTTIYNIQYPNTGASSERDSLNTGSHGKKANMLFQDPKLDYRPDR